jgi:hypothetical protein
VWHGGGAGKGSRWRDSPELCLHYGIVGAEGFTGVQPEESSLASAWDWGGEGSQCGALRRDSGTEGRSERLVDARTSTVGGQWQSMTSGMLR